MLSALDYGIVLAYLAGMLVVGAMVARRIASFRDYFIAGGRMTTALLVCTLVSTYYGLDVLFGGSEVSYQEGLVAWFVYLRPYYIVILIAALFIARRLRQHDFLSLPDIGGRFYGNGTRVLFAIASFLYALPILSIMGIGIVLDLTLGIPFVWGVLIGAGVSVAYTIMGGVVADALTDTAQFVLMCVTLSIAAAVVLNEAGGGEALWSRLPASYLDPLGTYPPGVLIAFATAALSAMVEPAFYQRIFAAVSYRAVLVALLIGVGLWAAFDWVVTVVGMAAAARGIEVEPRYALLTLTLEALPRGLDGLFVAGVLACAMSTIDSYLLIAGGNIAYDIYRPFVRPAMTDAELIRLTRWMIVVAALVTLALALFFKTIVAAWIFMTTMLIATTLVPIMAALYLPRTATPRAGLASAVTGFLASVAYYVAAYTLGSYDAEWATQIIRLEVAGRTIELWQEYSLLFALPASAAAYALGAAPGRRSATP